MPQKTKEIDKRIRSIRNTQQITKAMKMVAAAKLRRAEERLKSSRPYAAKLAELLSGLSAGGPVDHPLCQEKPLRKRLVLVIVSDKGLCGSFNSGMLRLVHRYLAENGGPEQNQLYIIGRRANDFFRRRNQPIDKAIIDMGGVVQLERVNQVADDLMRSFLADEVQEVVVFFTRFISTLSYRPQRARLLPLGDAAEAEYQAPATMPAMPAGTPVRRPRAAVSDVIYEPSAAEVLQALLPKAVRNRVYMAAAESFASEHAARMTSMTAATDNASDIIDKLVLFRNRARQSAITQEISEIVGGAEALV